MDKIFICLTYMQAALLFIGLVIFRYVYKTFRKWANGSTGVLNPFVGEYDTIPHPEFEKGYSHAKIDHK